MRSDTAVEIVKKIKAAGQPSLRDKVGSINPFGLHTSSRPKSTGDLTLIWNGGRGKFPRRQISSGVPLIDKWKVLTSKVSYDHAGSPGKDGKRRVLSKLILAPPGTICTATYIVVESFDSKDEAENLLSFLKLKLPRFLIAQLCFSQDITRERFAFVPEFSWKEKYEDKLLYQKYGLSDNEINFIEDFIKPME